MFDPTTMTGFHTWLSLVALAAGMVVTLDLTRGNQRPGWIGIFLITAVATSLTGYLLPAGGLLPSHIVGAISLVALAVAALALYGRNLAGPWRNAFSVGVVTATYLLAFVGLVQSFQKIPALGGTGPVFLVVQAAVLLGFVVAGVVAFRARPAFATIA